MNINIFLIYSFLKSLDNKLLENKDCVLLMIAFTMFDILKSLI